MATMSNGVTGGIFANLTDLQASKPRLNTRVELSTGERYSIDTADAGGGIPVNGMYANRVYDTSDIGVAEWNAAQEYFEGSYAQIDGFLFVSKTDDNTGNDPQTDGTNWKLVAHPIKTAIDITNSNVGLPAGTIISTDGFAEPGDGGAGGYLVEAGDSSNGFNRIIMGTGDTAVLQEDIPSIVQLGAISGADSSSIFVGALGLGVRFIVPDNGYTYNVSGTLPIKTGSVMEFVGNPSIHITVAGDQRGFHFEDGTTDAYIEGTADVQFTVTTSGSDGSYSNAFLFGQFYYTGDALGTKRCGIKSKLRFTLNGPANGNPIAIYGYSEDCFYTAPEIASGTTNIAYPAHWGSNGSPGVLPTKTWHPHNCEIRGAFANNVGPNFNGVVLSSVGTFYIEDLTINDVEEGLIVFVGDYGYSYSDNITEAQGCDVTIDRIECRGSFDYGVSVDMQSSGLNGSSIWTGSDHKASVLINKLRVQVDSASTDSRGIVATGLDSLILRDFDFVEDGIANNDRAFEVFGCNYVLVRGRAISRAGHLVRNCGYVDIDIETTSPERDVDASFYGLSLAQTFTTTTTDGAIVIGETSITLDSSNLVLGPGGFLQFGGEEMEIRSSTFVGGTQTIEIEPSKIDIPDSSTVTLIQTIKKARVGPSKYTGYRVGVRNTGNATAKMRNLLLDGTSFDGCGLFDVEANEVKGFKALNTQHSNSGKTTSTLNRYGIEIGGNAEQYQVIAPHFDDTCGGLRYGVRCDSSSSSGIVDNVLLESYNAGATNPAAVSFDSAGGPTDVKVGMVVATGGKTEIYPG